MDGTHGRGINDAIFEAQPQPHPLTGLYNRRGFLLLAGQQWQLALRAKVPFLLFYADVDESKRSTTLSVTRRETWRFNRWRTCSGSFRKADVISRLGGDEFVMAAIDSAVSSRAVLEQRLSEMVKQSK